MWLMRCAFILFAIATLFVTGAESKKKPAEVQVLSASGRRAVGKISIDVKVRNTGEKPIEGLILLFDFMAPGRQVVTTQKASADEEVLDPGQESQFRVELNQPPRAVEFQIGAVDSAERELRVADAGPFVIE